MKRRIDNGIDQETGECVRGCCEGDTSGTGAVRHTEPVLQYDYLAYFVLLDGMVKYGLRCRTQREAWKDYASIIRDPDVEWARGLDPFRESGVVRVLHAIR